MDFLIISMLAVLGAALTIGGIVGYRGSNRTGVRASSAAAVAAGLVMWLIILMVVPVSRSSDSSGSPDPETQITTGMIAPNLRLTFNGLEYNGVEILGNTDSAGAGAVCCGTPINPSNMTVVGSGTRHNLDDELTVQVYQTKVEGTTDIYTLNPAQSIYVECEPCRVEEVTATWVRWSTR